MPSLQEHCAATEELLGQPFEEVHRWLDEFAGKPPYGMKHRHLRHHSHGVKEARHLFGEDGARAARLHIEMDLAQEGWTRDNPFPRDADHYRAMGLFRGNPRVGIFPIVILSDMRDPGVGPVDCPQSFPYDDASRPTGFGA